MTAAPIPASATSAELAPLVPAERIKGISYPIRDIVLVANEVKKTGKEMLYLNIGDPNKFDFDTPKHVIDAIVERGLRARQNGYAPSEGVKEATDAIRRYAETKKGIKPVLDVFTGHGASEPIEIALTALVNPGENILAPNPGYPLYAAVMAKLGGMINPYYLDEASDFQPDVDDMARRINAKTRAVVLINPNNPTGAVASRQTIQRIVELCVKHNLVLLSDEIYDRLIYGDVEHVSPGSLSPDLACLTFNGLSKVYFGPGLRMGWCITSGPEKRLRPLIAAMGQLVRARLCASSPVQYAVQPALEGDHSFLKTELAKLQRRRDMTYQMLNAIPGISCVKPTGAFYAFPKINIRGSDEEWVKKLIYATGVVVVHGEGFGQKPGTKHFRVVFLPQEDVLHKAYTAIGEFMKSNA